MSHEELNPYHRLLGRILITFLCIHASMYLNFYIMKGLLLKRIQERDVILGLIAISSILIIGTSALAKIRDWNYRVFFIIHVCLAATLLPTLYFHVSHVRPYILEMAGIYIIIIVQRNINQKNAQASIALVPHTNLISLTIRLNKDLNSRTYIPGQHIYVSLPATLTSPLYKFRMNPFTVANLPAKDGSINLVARGLSGTTEILTRITRDLHGEPTAVGVEGPYGAAANFPDLANTYDRVLLVAGGVGATFTMPIYRSVLGTARKDQVRFIWAVRSVAEASWALSALREDPGSGLPKRFELYVTGKQDARGAAAWGDDGEEIELQERGQLLREEEDDGAEEGKHGAKSGPGKHGRPDLRRSVDEVFGDADVKKVAVLVCGPSGMGDALRKEIGRWVAKGREVWWHHEEFSW